MPLFPFHLGPELTFSLFEHVTREGIPVRWYGTTTQLRVTVKLKIPSELKGVFRTLSVSWALIGTSLRIRALVESSSLFIYMNFLILQHQCHA